MNQALRRTLILSAERVMRRGRDLCETARERRRRSQFLNYLAKYAKVFPRMSRYVLLPEATVMHILHLDRLMPLVDSMDEAVDRLRNDSSSAASGG